MTNEIITYYEHYRNIEALSVINEYCLNHGGITCMRGAYDPCSLVSLQDYLLSRTYQKITPVFELEQLTRVEDGRYPSEEFLVCLREDNTLWQPENIDMFLNIIRVVWWAESSGMLYDEETKTLILHTWGWSGNEAIIEALSNNPVWWLYMRDAEAGGHYAFKFLLDKAKK